PRWGRGARTDHQCDRHHRERGPRTGRAGHRNHSFQDQAHGAWIDDSDFVAATAVHPDTLTRTAGELSPLMPSVDGVEETARYSVAPARRWGSTYVPVTDPNGIAPMLIQVVVPTALR